MRKRFKMDRRVKFVRFPGDWKGPENDNHWPFGHGSFEVMLKLRKKMEMSEWVK